MGPTVVTLEEDNRGNHTKESDWNYIRDDGQRLSCRRGSSSEQDNELC